MKRLSNTLKGLLKIKHRNLHSLTNNSKEHELYDFINNITKTFILNNDGGIYFKIIHEILEREFPNLIIEHELYDANISSLNFNKDRVVIMQIYLILNLNNNHSNYLITFYNDCYESRMTNLETHVNFQNAIFESTLNALLTEPLKKQFKDDYDIYLKPITNSELYDY